MVSKVVTICLVLLSFAIHVCLANTTKWVYVHHNFKYPLFLSGTHMLMSYLAAAAGLFVFKLVQDPVKLSFREQVFTVAPFSAAGALSLGCSNAALVHLYPSFHQMLQNSGPIWTVLTAMVLQQKRFNAAAYLCLIPVCSGGAICAYGEQSNWVVIGVVLSCMSSVMRGVKSVLQQHLLRDAPRKIDSISLVYYSAPLNLGLFLVASLVFEGTSPWIDFVQLSPAGQFWLWSCASAAAAYNLVAFLCIGLIGAVMSVAVSTLRAPTIIITSCAIFGNAISAKQVVGFIIGIIGVLLYDRYSVELKAETADLPKNISLPTTDAAETDGLQRDADEELDPEEGAPLQISPSSAEAPHSAQGDSRTLSPLRELGASHSSPPDDPFDEFAIGDVEEVDIIPRPSTLGASS